MAVALYRNSFADAERSREIGKWRESHKENVRCKERLDELISSYYHENRLDGDIVKDICAEFGIERVQWVLTNTIRENIEDGRYRPETKEWCKKIYFPKDDNNHEFALTSHPELVNGVVGMYRRYIRKDLGILDRSDCILTDEPQNYEGQLLILKTSALTEEYKKGDFQLFYANCGFGCSPTALGRKVFGMFLIDGEETNFSRSDFYGIADESKIPDWAVERLNEIRSEQTETEDEGMVMS